MSAFRTSVMACLLVAACDGNPISGGGGGGVDPGDPSTSVSSLPGTVNPSANSDITRTEEKVTDAGANYGNGFAEGFKYDPVKDTFTVDNLAFDGANVYKRDNAVPTLGIAQVYKANATYADDQTGQQIDQFSYRALYGVSTSGRSSFAIVRTGAYIPFGFGGFVFSREGKVVLPTSGQARYDGEYSGLRDFDGVGGMQMVTGDMTMAIDFNDFNPDESATGNGAGIQGSVTNRHVFDLNGNDITNSVLAEINADKTPDVDLTELPTMVFHVGPGVLDNNGEAEGSLQSVVNVSGTNETFESGKYYAVISGSGADEVVGVIVVTSSVNDITVRETGGFILYRP